MSTIYRPTPRSDLRLFLRRLRCALAAYWRRQSKAGAERVRLDAMVADLVALAEPYKRAELLATIRWAIPREDGWR